MCYGSCNGSSSFVFQWNVRKQRRNLSLWAAERKKTWCWLWRFGARFSQGSNLSRKYPVLNQSGRRFRSLLFQKSFGPQNSCTDSTAFSSAQTQSAFTSVIPRAHPGNLMARQSWTVLENWNLKRTVPRSRIWSTSEKSERSELYLCHNVTRE